MVEESNLLGEGLAKIRKLSQQQPTSTEWQVGMDILPQSRVSVDGWFGCGSEPIGILALWAIRPSRHGIVERVAVGQSPPNSIDFDLTHSEVMKLLPP